MAVRELRDSLRRTYACWLNLFPVRTLISNSIIRTYFALADKCKCPV
jgi:hypothetical protein